MKCRYTFSVRGDLRLDSPFPFTFEGREYGFETDESGFLTEISVTLEVPDESQWPKVTSLAGPGPKLSIRGSSPSIGETKRIMRVIEGLLAPYGLRSINIGEPRQQWLPSDQQEKAKLQLFSSQFTKGHLPRSKIDVNPFSCVVLAIISAEGITPFEPALTFFRRGCIDMEEWAYIDAAYDFFFMLELLYGKGKTQNFQLRQVFQESVDFVASIKDTLSDQPTIQLLLSEPGCANSFRAKYLGKSSDEIIDALLNVRGYLHHQSSKRTGWHPEEQDAYKADAIVLQNICLRVFFRITNPCLLSPKNQDIAENVFRERKVASPTANAEEPSDSTPKPISEELKNHLHKKLDDFFAACSEQCPATLILTTDGWHHNIVDSAHPLPPRYLKQWEEDKRRMDLGLTWDK